MIKSDKQKKKKARRCESGVALVMVLGVLATCMLLIVHMMTESELLGREAMVSVLKSRLRYQAESAADISFWMHLTDRRLVSNRQLGQSAEDEIRASNDFEPWMLDRRPHTFNDGLIVSYLAAGNNGFDYSNPESLKDGISLDDDEYTEFVNEFIDILTDYVDTDDLRQLNGMEVDDYGALGYPTLPRNGTPQYRSEIYWMPNWDQAIIGEVAIIHPDGLSLDGSNSSRRRRGSNSQNSQPSFFSASPQVIARRLDLSMDDDSFLQVMDSRNAWMESGMALSDSLTEELLTKINGRFDFREPDLAAIIAVAKDEGGECSSVYRVTRMASISNNSFYADTAKETLSIWERILE